MVTIFEYMLGAAALASVAFLGSMAYATYRYGGQRKLVPVRVRRRDR